jgi:ankyrin repeat protein
MELRNQLFEARNQNGDTALSVCIAGGHAGDIVDLLLENSSSDSLDVPNEKGVTPLLVACEQDDVDLCKKLLEKGASLDVQDSKGASPLAVAAFCGNVNVLKEVLLDKKELLERPNTNGCTPLWLAARAGRDEVVLLLLDSGADRTKANNDGLTPVGVAIKYKREKVSGILDTHVSCDTTEGDSTQEQGTD